MKTETKQETYHRCKKCDAEIRWNTHKKMVDCKCGAIGVDGRGDYVRIIGDKKDWEIIKK